MTISVPVFDDVGEDGYSGAIACNIVRLLEALLYPFMLRASTINSY